MKKSTEKNVIIKLYEESLNDIIWTHKIQATLLDNYVYNAIVNHAIYKYKYKGNKGLNENDLLQEIIYKQYKNSKTNNRFTILTNYLNKNKYEYKR